MCDPVTGALIVTALSGGAKAFNTQRALRGQDREIARGIQKKSADQREANQRVQERVRDLQGSTGQEERAASLTGFQQALQRGRGATEGSLPAVSGASERFVEGTEAAKGRLQTAGQDIAQNLSVLQGALDQRQREGATTGRLGSEINRIGSNISAEDFLARLRASGHQPNPWVNALADVASGAARGTALRVPRGAAINPATIVDPVALDNAVLYS